MRQLAIIGSPPQRLVPSAEKFGHTQIRLLPDSRGHRPPSPPALRSFFSLHPYKPIIPSRSLRSAFPTPQHFRGGSGTQIPQSGAPRAEEIQRRPRLLNSLAFVSYLPSFQGSSDTPDLVSAQAQQNSPARLPRSRHPGDRANSDQSASVGRSSPGALL